jgi:hypothetical protein
MNRVEVEEIVQTTVRKLNCGPEACLTNPRVLSFFNIMKDSVTRCITAVSAASTTAEEKAASYKTVLDWEISRQQDEVQRVVTRYPSVKDAYTYSAVYIVEQTYKKENRQLKLKLPSFQQFLFTFYTQVLTSEPLAQGRYDGLQFFEKEMLCCQAFCNALYNSIRTEPVEKQQSVIVEHGKSEVSTKISPQLIPNSSAVKSVTGSKKTQSSPYQMESQLMSASRFSIRALSPHDSVSQMLKPSNAASAAAATASTTGSLTEDTLNKHRSKMGQRVHPAAVSAASVRAAASSVSAAPEAKSRIRSNEEQKKESVKVIDLVEHPQKFLTRKDEDDDYTTSSSESDDNRGKSKKHVSRNKDPRDLDRDFERDYDQSSFYSKKYDRDPDRGSSRDSVRISPDRGSERRGGGSERSDRSSYRSSVKDKRSDSDRNPNRRH